MVRTLVRKNTPLVRKNTPLVRGTAWVRVRYGFGTYFIRRKSVLVETPQTDHYFNIISQTYGCTKCKRYVFGIVDNVSWTFHQILQMETISRLSEAFKSWQANKQNLFSWESGRKVDASCDNSLYHSSIQQWIGLRVCTVPKFYCAISKRH